MTWDLEGYVSETLHMQQGQASAQISGTKPAYIGYIVSYDINSGMVQVANPLAGAVSPTASDVAGLPVGTVMISPFIPLATYCAGRSDGTNPINGDVTSWGWQIAPIGGSSPQTPTAGEQVLVCNVRNDIGYSACAFMLFNSMAKPPGNAIPVSDVTLKPGEWLRVHPSGTTEHWDNLGNINTYAQQVPSDTDHVGGCIKTMAYGGISFNTGNPDTDQDKPVDPDWGDIDLYARGTQAVEGDPPQAGGNIKGVAYGGITFNTAEAPDLAPDVLPGDIDLNATNNINAMAYGGISINTGTDPDVPVDVDQGDIVLHSVKDIHLEAVGDDNPDGDAQDDIGQIIMLATANNTGNGGSQTDCGNVDMVATASNTGNGGSQTHAGNIEAVLVGANDASTGTQTNVANQKTTITIENNAAGATQTDTGNASCTIAAENKVSNTTASNTSNIMLHTESKNSASACSNDNSSNASLITKVTNTSGDDSQTNCGNISLIAQADDEDPEATQTNCGNVNIQALATAVMGAAQTNTGNVAIVAQATDNPNPSCGNIGLGADKTASIIASQVTIAAGITPPAPNPTTIQLSNDGGAPATSANNIAVTSVNNFNMRAQNDITGLAQNSVTLGTQDIPSGNINSVQLSTNPTPTAADADQIWIDAKGTVKIISEEGSISETAVAGSIGLTAGMNITETATLQINEIAPVINETAVVGDGTGAINMNADGTITITASDGAQDGEVIIEADGEVLIAMQGYTVPDSPVSGMTLRNNSVEITAGHYSNLGFGGISLAVGSDPLSYVVAGGAFDLGHTFRTLMTSAFVNFYNIHEHTGVTAGGSNTGGPRTSDHIDNSYPIFTERFKAN